MNDFEAGRKARAAKQAPIENPHFAEDAHRFNVWSDGWVQEDVAKLGRKSSMFAEVSRRGMSAKGLTASWGRP